MFDDEIRELAQRLLDRCRTLGLMIATAESCTGGLISGALTAIPGSSDVVDRGYVTYSYAAKTEMLGVPAAMIAERGAVSEDVARAMAEGALLSAKHLSLAVTGVAGPGSDSQAKPAGLVHFAAGLDGRIEHRACRYGDIGRDEVRRRSVVEALRLALAIVPDDQLS
jgi:nicotinamide-nucleotide amidase